MDEVFGLGIVKDKMKITAETQSTLRSAEI